MACSYLITPLILGGEILLLELSKTFILQKWMRQLGRLTTKRMLTCPWLISVLTKPLHHELRPYLDLHSGTAVVLIFVFTAFPSPRYVWHIFSSADCRRAFLDSSFKIELLSKKKSPSFKAENSLFLLWLVTEIFSNFCNQSNFCCTILSCVALTVFLIYKHQRWVEVKGHLL